MRPTVVDIGPRDLIGLGDRRLSQSTAKLLNRTRTGDLRALMQPGRARNVSATAVPEVVDVDASTAVVFDSEDARAVAALTN
ncbi:hypothetical protein [Streptomyces sp. NPDC048349]|uniref:hypothetical protein n=1 Tax=Streptomyces sp. NPDC048349 TaxID=3155486 RepID=UPI003448B16E